MWWSHLVARALLGACRRQNDTSHGLKSLINSNPLPAGEPSRDLLSDRSGTNSTSPTQSPTTTSFLACLSFLIHFDSLFIFKQAPLHHRFPTQLYLSRNDTMNAPDRSVGMNILHALSLSLACRPRRRSRSLHCAPGGDYLRFILEKLPMTDYQGITPFEEHDPSGTCKELGSTGRCRVGVSQRQGGEEERMGDSCLIRTMQTNNHDSARV